MTSLVMILSPSNAVVAVDSQVVLTANINEELDKSNEFVWEVNGSIIDNDGNVLNFSPSDSGIYEIKCSLNVDGEIIFDSSTIRTDDMVGDKPPVTGATITLNPMATTVHVGEKFTIYSTTTGIPDGSTSVYKWNDDPSNNLLSYSATPTEKGTLKVHAELTITNASYADTTIKSDDAIVTVLDKEITGAIATASTSTPDIKYNETWSATVDVTNAPSGSTFTYLWNTGETTKTISGVGTTFGTKTYSCNVTISCDGYESATIKSTDTTITTAFGDITATATATPDTQQAKYNTLCTVVSTVTGAPDGAKITYDWGNGITTKDYSIIVNKLGNYSAQCTIMISHPNYNTATIKTNVANIEVIKNTIDATATASTKTPSIEIGDPWTVTVDVDGSPLYTTISYLWNTGETTKSISGTASTIGTNSYYCTVTISRDGYETAVIKSNTIDIVASGHKMKPNVYITGPDYAIAYGLTYAVYANADNIPNGANVSYLWNTGDTTKMNSHDVDTINNITFYCDVTVTADGYEPWTGRTPNFILKTAKGNMINVVCKATSPKTDIDVGEDWSITTTLTGVIDGSTTTYSWIPNGETTKDISGTATEIGETTYQCTAIVSNPNYNDCTARSNLVVISVEKDVMTLTNTITTSDDSVKFGDSFTATSTVTGIPEGSTTEWKWSNGMTGQTITVTPTSIGSIDLTCVVYVSNPAYANASQLSNDVTVSVTRADMNPTVSISTGKDIINCLDEYIATATTTGIPDSSTISYSWSNGDNGQTTKRQATAPGEIDLTCSISVTNPNYNTGTASSNTIKINVNKIDLPVSLDSIEFTPDDIDEVGDIYSATYVYSSDVDHITTTQVWDNGDTEPHTDRRVSASGYNSVSVTVTFNHPDYNSVTKTKSAGFYVKDGDNDVRYIHPLECRSSSFIWCGYWVLDEIQIATLNGIDWKKPDDTNLLYKLDLRTIAKMIDDFPNIEIMESRNGRILKKADFDVGIFY